MSTRTPSPWLASIACAGLFLFAAPPAGAEDMTVVAPVTKIEIAPDGKSATAVLTDDKGQATTVTVTDELTLDKFKDKRIVEGDEIRAKFDAKDGRNASKSFKKTAGC